MIKLKILLKSKIFLLILLLLSFFSIYLYSNKKHKSIYSNEDNSFICIVNSISKNNKVILDCNETLEGFIEDINNIEIGDILKVEGVLSEYNEQRNFNLFDYKEYQNNSNIFYKIKVSNYKRLGKSKKISLTLKNFIFSRIKNLESYSYLKAFILGDKNEIDSEVMNIYKENGIVHLFSISGMHISLLIELIDNLYKKNNLKRWIFTLLFLIGYYSLIKSISLFRCIIFYISKRINNTLNLNIEKKKLFLIDVCLIIILKPSYIYNIGFYYSVIISIGISLASNKIFKINSKILRTIYIVLIAFLLSFPLNIYTNFEVNLLSIIYNLLFIPFVSIIIFPLSLITLLFPIFDKLFIILLNTLEELSIFFSNFNIMLIFKKPSIFMIIIYYLLIIAMFYNKKIIYIMIVVLFIHYNYNVIFKQDYILMFDVGQGDSVLIHSNNYNILIDTGGTGSNYSIAENITIPVLKSLGISKLNLLVISHGDMDHGKEAINLINHFKIDKIYLNSNKFNDLEKSILKEIKLKKITYEKITQKYQRMGNIKMSSLSYDTDNENDSSIINYIVINDYKFLFTGDISSKIEQKLISDYKIQDIEILKVAHHGSKTSSSSPFLNTINPKYSLISVGINNKYGHPNNDTLERLKNSQVYRTDLFGSILIKISKKDLNIYTCI